MSASVFQQGQPISLTDAFSASGVPTNPTALVYTLLNPDGTETTYTWPGAPQISNPSVGSFLLSLDPPTLAGLYQYDVDATGAVVASRAGSFFVMANRTSLQTSGPCTPWVSPQEIWDCCGQPMTIIGEGSMATQCPVDMSQFAIEASQLLFELSGRIYPGLCEKTVRPCTDSWCGFQMLSRGHIVYDPYDSWGWWWTGINWNYNGRAPCGCQPLDRVLLSGYPVQAIIEVKIDGVVVNPVTYRLDQHRWLSRVRDPAAPDVRLFWPHCQALDLPDTEPGTFSVSYLYGQEPPLVGIHAASQLGCELWKSCTGQDCALPTGTTRVTRQGITISRTSFQRDIKTGIWATGMSIVDAFLSTVNPSGLKRRPSIWSPDGKRFARQVGS